MNEVLSRFEAALQSYTANLHGAALRAVAKKYPAGYSAWLKAQISDTPQTAEGFDRAQSKLEGLGLSRAQAMGACGRWHAGHGAWLKKQNEDRGRQKEKNRSQKAPTGAPGVAHAHALITGAARAR